jgi:peptidoglycan/LPS O-acetylase OafA/YrhL
MRTVDAAPVSAPRPDPAAPEAKSPRMLMIDGLRGIAAFSVTLHHLDGAMVLAFGQWAPAWIEAVLSHGYLGVDIFFVLSGFVIAFGLRDVPGRWGFLGRFALRRSVRLDIPYWTSMAFEIALAATVAALGYSTWAGATIPQVLAHVAYAQEFLGYRHIVAVYWTLCFEIQFYLLLVLLAIWHRRLESHLRPSARRVVAFTVLSALFVASLLSRFGDLGSHLPSGLALIRWYQFSLGALVWWVHVGACDRRWLYAAWAAILTAAIGRQDFGEHLLPIIVSAGIFLALAGDRMQRWLSSPVLQFLGAISYSLYLFHATMGWRTIRLLGLALPHDPVWAWAAFGIGTASAVTISWVAWRLVERPALALSRRVPLR